MEAIIKVQANELDNNLIEKLKTMLSGLKNPEIEIRISDDGNSEYFRQLDNSIKQYDRGEVINFSKEELTAYLKK